METNIIIQNLTNALDLANKKGCYSLVDSHAIAETLTNAIQKLQELESVKSEKQENG